MEKKDVLLPLPIVQEKDGGKSHVEDAEKDGKRRKHSPMSNFPVLGLKRQIGLLGMVAFLVGAIIGGGIFASPRSVATYSGSTGGILLTWVIAGCIAITGALIFCELGLTFPNNCAGEYTYVYEAFGDFPAFVNLYLEVLTRPAFLALVCIVVGDYIMTAAVGEGDSSYSKTIGGAIVLVHMCMNCYSVKWVERIQIFFTAAKMIPIIMLVLTGVVRLGQGHTENFQDAFNGTSTSVSDIVFSLYGGLWAYGGWNTLNFLTAEAANPVQDIPIATYLAMPTVIICYIMVNIAYLTVHTPTEIADSGAIAVAIGKEMYGPLHWTIPALVACSVFGSSNGESYKCARIFYEAANRNQLPSIIGSVHRTRHTPVPAIILVSLLSCIVLLPDATNFRSLLNFVQFFVWLQLSLTVAAMMWLRRSRPDLTRPLKVFIGLPILFFVITLFLIAAPFVKYPVQQLYGICVILPVVPLYFAFIKYQILPKRFIRWLDYSTKRIQHLANLGVPNQENQNIPDSVPKNFN